MTLDELDLRVERLGRGNRVLKGAVCLLAFGVLAALVSVRWGSCQATVDAQRIIVRDGLGRIQGELRASGDRSGLVLLDSGGDERLRLGCSEDGSTVLSIATGEDKGTRRRIDLRAASDGWSTLSFHDEKSIERLTIGLAYDGEPRLRMYTQDRKSRLSMGSDMSGRAEVIVHDGGGTERGVLRSAPDGSTSLSLYNAEGAAIFSAPPQGPQPARRLQAGTAGGEP